MTQFDHDNDERGGALNRTSANEVDLFPGNGEMARRVRAFDWARTSLGPIDRWPISLRTTAAIVLAAPIGMILLWGRELVQLYNDGYREVMGVKHPGGLGQRNIECWPEVWNFTGPIYEGVLERGESFTFTDQPLVLERHGQPDEGCFTLSYTPVLDDDGRIGGILVTVVETTSQVQTRSDRERQLLQANERLRDLGTRYRTLFESIDSGFAVIEILVDADGAPVDYRFLEANAAFESHTGLTAPVGHTARERVPDLERFWIETYARVAETGESVRFQHGSEAMGRMFDVFAVRVGEPAERHVALLFTDITDATRAARERSRLVETLAAERARLEDIIRIAPAFMAVLQGPQHVITLTNAGYDALAGGRPIRGRTVAEALPEAAAQGFVALLDEVLRTGVPFAGREVPYRRPDVTGAEDERYVDFVYQALTDADGTRSGVFVHGVDVTDQVRARHQMEQLLRESEAARHDAVRARERIAATATLTAALSSLHSVHDVAQVILRETTAILGAAGTVLGRVSADGEWIELLGATDMPEDAQQAWQRFPTSAPVPLAEAARTAAPIFLPSRDAWAARYPDMLDMLDAAGHAANMVLPLIVDGRTLGVLALAFDEPRAFEEDDRTLALTIARQCAQALERARLFDAENAARQEAEGANRAKSEFLAVMSHELRTPLHAIDGYAELLELGIRGPVSDEQRQDLARIRKSQKHLLGLINGVLNFAQVEAGVMNYDLEDVLVEEVLATCEALTVPQVRKHDLSLHRPSCDDSHFARADREKLQQVVLNLLSNAIKFTAPGGEISLHCSRVDNGHGATVQIIVADTGIGIAPHQLRRVFEPFVQVNSALTRTRDGTRLGLAISRDLARGMGGDLTVESVLGVGSTFTLELPAASSRQGEVDKAKRPAADESRQAVRIP